MTVTVRGLIIRRWRVECDDPRCGFVEECSTRAEADGKKTDHEAEHENETAWP